MSTRTIPLTHGYEAVVDAADYLWLNRWKWNAKPSRYTVYAVRYEFAPKRQDIRMHREIIQAPPNRLADHINRNGLDNRRSNLRLCTPVQNGRNSKRRIDSISGFMGVSFHKASGKWRAQIRIGPSKRKHLGLFDDPRGAANAYDEAAIKYHGEFATTNRTEEEA